MVTRMSADKQKSREDTNAVEGEQRPAKPEPRFSRAAVTYIDALLEIQRERFEREANGADTRRTLAAMAQGLNLPSKGQYFAEGDNFIGTGWSELGHRRDGTAFRWMGRIGTLLLPLDLSRGAQISIEGCGYTRRRHLKGLTVWVDDYPVEGTVARKGFNRWIFTGKVGPFTARPYHILRLQCPGQSRLAVGVDSFVSIAVSGITVESSES